MYPIYLGSPKCVNVCIPPQCTGSGLNAMHVASIQGRADVVQLLITYAEETLLKQSLKDILNAKNKASDCELFQAHTIYNISTQHLPYRTSGLH